MKIAFTTDGNQLSAVLETRFGRATAFLIYDTENKSIEIIDNKQQLDSSQGAGIQAAKIVIDSGAGALVSGHCGPKAMRVLSTREIDVYVSEAMPLKEILDLFEQGKLVKITKADVDGHWV